MRRTGVALAAVLALTGIAPERVASQEEIEDNLQRLVVRLESIVQQGDWASYRNLLADSADRDAAMGFLATEVIPGMTDAVIQERTRVPLDGTLPGRGYRLALDVFQEYGDRARVAAWSIDIKQLGEAGSDREWLIADQQRVSSVEDLYRLSLDATKQFSVKNLKVVDEDLELTLRDGSLFVSTVDQGTTAVVFVGSGEMTFQPLPEREVTQIRIFSGADAVVTPFDSIYMRFNPEAFSRLFSTDALAAVAVDRDELRKAERVFREQSPKSYVLDLGDLSRDSWSPVPEPRDFVAEIDTRRFETLTYSRSSSLLEDVSLFDRRRGKTIAVYSSAEKEAMLGQADGASDAPFDVSRYDIDVSVDPYRRWIEGRVRMEVRVHSRALNTLAVRLAEPLVIQSAISEQYGRLFTMRAKGQDTVMIGLPATLTSGAHLTMTVAYAGRLDPQSVATEALASAQQPEGDAFDIIRKPEPSFLFSNQVNWYPRPAASHYATATLRITVPADLGCVASGTLDRQATVATAATGAGPARNTFVFHAGQPLRYFAFALSRLEQIDQVSIEFPAAGSTRLAPGTAATSLDLSVIANPGHRRAGRAVAERATNITRFYQSLLEDVPYPSLTIALVENTSPGGHSPGYFAILNWPATPTSFFQRRNDPASFTGFPDFVLAHEIAHQWWGQSVGWRNYHEQWLSEAFAQYFAAMYAAHLAGGGGADADLFHDVMRQMRRWASDMTDQGSISLGSRLGHLQSDARIFRAVVYDKGALVLHMLRQLMGDEAFFAGVRRFYQTARFKSVGTAELRAAMEAEIDRSLARFFDRWIYGVTLPRLAFDYEADSEGVVLTVTQIGEIFELPVAVTLRYSDGSSSEVVVPVEAEVARVRVPLARPLRSAEISRVQPPLAELVRN